MRRLTTFYDLALGTQDIDVLDVVDALVRVNLWEDQGGYYLVHDYLDYQPSREAVAAERRQKAEAGHLGGVARAKALAKAGRYGGSAQAGAVAESKPVPVPVSVKDPERSKS